MLPLRGTGTPVLRTLPAEILYLLEYNLLEAGAWDAHQAHEAHDLQGALFFRVTQQNSSIRVPKTC